MTPEAREAVERAEVLFGAQRMLEQCDGLAKKSYPCYLPQDVAAAVAGEDAQDYAVLVSGDVGFYSAAAGLCEALAAYDIRFVPGISTVNAFFAKLKLPWQDAMFASVHGRETNVVDTVRRNRLAFCLTGNNANELGTALCKAGLGHIKTHTGENLGADTEQIREMTAMDLAQGTFPSLTVLLFVNEAFDDRIPCGLPDSSFSRLDGIPMTKSETRALILSKLSLRPDSICWDVGAGTASVTVEMALNAYRGHVYAVERREDAIPLIERNCASFHLGNTTSVCGEAPAALESLPAPNAVFVGGSGGELDRIIDIVLHKNPRARIVVTAITIETISAALAAFSKAGMDAEIIQVNIARGRRAGKLHLMEAQNPVSILSAGGA
jgi:precorrin-6Y C5,15-methyltransferase (decarboxylating)